MRTKKHLFLLFLSLISAELFAQRPRQAVPTKTRILLVLDASGSMNKQWQGQKRIDIAKEKISHIIDSMKMNKKVEFALRVYGHQFPSLPKNCADSRLEVGFRPGNVSHLIRKLYGIEAQGTTPIAYSLGQSPKDFPPDGGKYRHVVILVTDGREMCDADPCAVSLALQKKGVLLKPFVIGMGVGPALIDAFKCMGDAEDAETPGHFGSILQDVIRETVNKTTITVELTDKNDRRVEKNVNMAFSRSLTGRSVYDLVHYRDKKRNDRYLANRSADDLRFGGEHDSAGLSEKYQF